LHQCEDPRNTCFPCRTSQLLATRTTEQTSSSFEAPSTSEMMAASSISAHRFGSIWKRAGADQSRSWTAPFPSEIAMNRAGVAFKNVGGGCLGMRTSAGPLAATIVCSVLSAACDSGPGAAAPSGGDAGDGNKQGVISVTQLVDTSANA